MVVTPMISSGVQVEMPRTANHSKKPDDGKDIIVSVTTNRGAAAGPDEAADYGALGSLRAGERSAAGPAGRETEREAYDHRYSRGTVVEQFEQHI